MKDSECVAFLQWSMPKLLLRWQGFRKVRKQVCKRIGRRLKELSLQSVPAYKAYLEAHPREWKLLDSMCRITISRFYRDRAVFEMIRSRIFSAAAERALSKGHSELLCWSAGCGSGEEAYTLSIVWNLCMSPEMRGKLELRIVATDADAGLLERARKGRYRRSALKDLPPDLIEASFERCGDDYAVMDHLKGCIRFVEQDIREQIPQEIFHVIFCRNLVFTYYVEDLQIELLRKISGRMPAGSFLVIGIHEGLPSGVEDLVPVSGAPCIFEKRLR